MGRWGQGRAVRLSIHIHNHKRNTAAEEEEEQETMRALSKGNAAAASKVSGNVQAWNARCRSVRANATSAAPHIDTWDATFPTPKRAFLFPGQGAQYVGMAEALAEEVPAAKEMFDRASELLGYDLLQVCAQGPGEKLNTTAVSQPAIYVASLAALEKLSSSENGKEIIEGVNVAAGLSLGEYTALVFAGAIGFEDGLRLVKARGEAMQEAAEAAQSGMVSVIGLDAQKCEELCKAASEESGQPVQIANYLCKGNYAISGSIEAIEAVEAIAKPNFKARMTVRLAVAGAFHTSFMNPAVDRLKEILEATPIVSPRIPVLSNVDVKAHMDPQDIRNTLAKQIVSPVQWERTLELLIASGLEESYEIGPGKVIAGIMKRVDRKSPVTNIEA